MDDAKTPFFEPRPGIEHALVEVSRLLVSSGEADLREVLRLVGEAVGAESAYLVTVDEEDELLTGDTPPLGTVTRWRRDGVHSGRLFDGPSPAPALRLLARTQDAENRPPPPTQNGDRDTHGEDDQDADQEGVAIPLLSQQDRFVGYLGIEHASLSVGTLREHGRVLSVFGDLLAGYLSRQRAERALSESEERWRKFVEFNPEAILVVADETILYANQACAHLLGFHDAAELTKYTLRDFLLADQYDVIEDRQQEHATGRAFTPFEHEIVRIDGEERLVETIAVGVPFKGIPAVQIVIRDVTDRKRSEERYRNFVQTISEGVWRIDLAEPTPALALPYLQAERILSHGYFAECNTMMTRILGAERTEAVIGQPLLKLVPALDHRLVQTFVEDGYRLHNYEFTVPGSERTASRHFALNAVGRIERGALVRIWGSCIEVTERVEMERRMVAVLEEQQERIGRDLHDSVGQLLTGIRMLSENLSTRYFEPDHDGAVAAQKVTSFAEEALQRVREICRGLVPPQLYQEGLASALQTLIANMDALSDVRCTFSHQAGSHIEDQEITLQLYRIAQEAISNALKHARPSHVWTRCAVEDGQLRLEVEDDGIGFDPEQNTGRSLGLYSMKRRASSIRADLSIDSEDGVGTMIRVVRPVHHPSGA